MQAMENFFYVPRYRAATLNQPVKYKYGGVLVRTLPYSTLPHPTLPSCSASRCMRSGLL